MIRLLINHPNVQLQFVHSTSNAGKPVSSVHHDLEGDTDLAFAENITTDIDVLFLCVGHGDAKVFMQQQGDGLTGIRIIDLSQDFRLLQQGQPAMHSNVPFVYGLPELNREQIRSATNIANPGCFASSIQLGLLPLAKAGLLNTVYTTGITGSTGAGQSLSPTSHFSWRANNIQAYKTLQHQHVNEIVQSLAMLQGNDDINLHFVPWRGDFTRGIYISSVVDCTLSLEEAYKLYNDFYAGHPFTIVSKKMIDMKQVVNTNKCLVHLEKSGDKLVIHSTLDNLLKGASGQAVQNMNLLFSLDETAGLKLKANYF
jgi:N-acetyl-gamma-glutamyl-phosphate reductase